MIFTDVTEIIYLFFLLVKGLKKYIKSSGVRKEKKETKVSLGEALKAYITKYKMTQEFVAASLGVSRQAVSKWENDTSDPSTSNLIALAKLYGISAEEILNKIKQEYDWMKKLITLVLTLVCIIGLGGCNNRSINDKQ
ncbi:MAG: helix-turn-helix transcriptional regulator [Lachnospiraceae bacterium]|nr:helix-turn-helix transcriptional regulator [Lachnospiraceae bacterium]